MNTDLQDIWDRTTHGGTVSEAEIAAVEAVLRGPDSGGRDLAILIIGVTRKPEPSLVALMHSFLTCSNLDAERSSALKVLCRYWGLWDEYLEYVLDKISPAAFDDDPAVAEQAFNLLGEYLWKHSNRDAWRRLISVYDIASADSRKELSKEAYWSIYVGLFGSKETLRRRMHKEYRENDTEVLANARAKAGLMN